MSVGTPKTETGGVVRIIGSPSVGAAAWTRIAWCTGGGWCRLSAHNTQPKWLFYMAQTSNIWLSCPHLCPQLSQLLSWVFVSQASVPRVPRSLPQPGCTRGLGLLPAHHYTWHREHVQAIFDTGHQARLVSAGEYSAIGRRGRPEEVPRASSCGPGAAQDRRPEQSEGLVASPKTRRRRVL